MSASVWLYKHICITCRNKIRANQWPTKIANKSYVQLWGHLCIHAQKNWLEIGRTVVYYSRASSAGIKCRHCIYMYLSMCVCTVTKTTELKQGLGELIQVPRCKRLHSSICSQLYADDYITIPTFDQHVLYSHMEKQFVWSNSGNGVPASGDDVIHKPNGIPNVPTNGLREVGRLFPLALYHRYYLAL